MQTACRLKSSANETCPDASRGRLRWLPGGGSDQIDGSPAVDDCSATVIVSASAETIAFPGPAQTTTKLGTEADRAE